MLKSTLVQIFTKIRRGRFFNATVFYFKNQITPATGAKFRAIRVEDGVGAREVWSELGEERREELLTLCARRVLVVVAVHEPVELRRVRVDIDVEVELHVLSPGTTSAVETGMRNKRE